MVARLQQLLCLGALLAVLAWWLLWRDSAPLLARCGLLLPFVVYGAVLASQYVLQARHWRDAMPRPGLARVVRAWWAELCCGVQVFFWRQPFRAAAEPDHLLPAPGRRGIVFIHGLVCNRGFWAPWMRRARALGLPHVAPSLEPPFGSIDAYVPQIEAAVARLEAATGQAPLLVCHSMGGLAARAWLRTPGAAARVARVVTIGSPHAGTWLAQLGHGENAAQMRLDSAWLRALAAHEAGRPQPPFTCWYSDCDNIVFPVSTAARPGADNRLLAGQPHVALAFHEQVMRETLALAA